jgi:DNA-binding transcriptional ArsR family regulator
MAPDPLSTTFAALADPTRRAILALLALGEASVTELGKPFRDGSPCRLQASQVPKNAGLIERGRDAQWRPCRLAPGPLKDAAEWLKEYRRFWEESLDRLNAYLNKLQNQEKTGGRLK